MADTKKKTEKSWPIDSMQSMWGKGPRGTRSPAKVDHQYRSYRVNDQYTWPFGQVRHERIPTTKMVTRSASDGRGVTVKTPKYIAKDQLADANKRAHKTMSAKMQTNEKKRKASDSARANKRRAGGSRLKGR